ncbi:MAG: PQQ-binding-like beta-propeller repeat protein [Saprospirales bacterium]|nr:PQQ-binding-like beta-propeller repeat protein [Saprospirales bacterium]
MIRISNHSYATLHLPAPAPPPAPTGRGPNPRRGPAPVVPRPHRRANAAFRLNEPAEAARWIAGAPAEHRSWEWHYLRRLANTSLLSVPTEGDKPTNLALSPAGRTCALPLPRGDIRLCDARDFHAIRTLQGHIAAAYAAAFGPAGAVVYSCSRDTTLRAWDAASGRELWQARTGGAGLACLAVHPGGSRVATASANLSTCLWDARSGERVLTLSTPVALYNVLFSADGKRLIGNEMNGKVVVWEEE